MANCKVSTKIILLLFFLLLKSTMWGQLSVSTTTVAFGSLKPGQTSTQRTVTVRNTSGYSADVYFYISSIPGLTYTFSDNSTGLGAGALFSTYITYRSRTAVILNEQRAVTGYIRDPNNTTYSVNVTFTATVSGTGPIVTLTPDNLDFGYVAINSTSTKSIIIKNTGDYQLEIISFSLPTTAGFGFATAQGARNIAVNGTYTLNVNFQPTVENELKTSNIIINHNMGSTTIQLTGIGGEPPAPPKKDRSRAKLQMEMQEK